MLRRTLLTLFFALTLRGLSAQEETSGRYRLADTPVVRESLTEVMSRPEFSRLRVEPPEPKEPSESPEWLKRFVDWLARVLGNRAQDSGTETVSFPAMELVLYVMAAVVLIAVVVFILNSVASARRVRKLDIEQEAARVFRGSRAPGETDPRLYWQRAQSLGEQKEFKKAIRELLLGAMSSLERRGLVRHRLGLTNRDYLRAVRGVARESLLTIASMFELVYFGRREATADAFRTCCREYHKSFLGGSA